MYTIQDSDKNPTHRYTGSVNTLLRAILIDSLGIERPHIILDGDENLAFFKLVGSDCGHSHGVTLEHPVSTAFVEIIRKKHTTLPMYMRLNTLLETLDDADTLSKFIQAQRVAAATLKANARDVVSADGKATGVKVLMPAELDFSFTTEGMTPVYHNYVAKMSVFVFKVRTPTSNYKRKFTWEVMLKTKSSLFVVSKGTSDSFTDAERACNDWVTNLYFAMMGDIDKRVQALGELHESPVEDHYPSPDWLNPKWMEEGEKRWGCAGPVELDEETARKMRAVLAKCPLPDVHQQRADLTGESRDVKEKNFAAIYGHSATPDHQPRDVFKFASLRDQAYHELASKWRSLDKITLPLELIVGSLIQDKIDAATTEAKNRYPNCDVTITVEGRDVRVTQVCARSGVDVPHETTVTVEHRPSLFNAAIQGYNAGADPNGWVVTEEGRKATAARGSKAHDTLYMLWIVFGRTTKGVAHIHGMPNTNVSMVAPLGDLCQDSILMQRHPDYSYTLFCPRGVAWALNRMGVTLPETKTKLPDSPPPAPDTLPSYSDFFDYVSQIQQDFATSRGFTVYFDIKDGHRRVRVWQINPHIGKKLLWVGMGFDIYKDGFQGKTKGLYAGDLTYAEAVKWMRWGMAKDMLALQGDWIKQGNPK